MGLAIIAAVAACVIGWEFSKAHGSHRGIPARRGQLRDYRKDRMHHGTRVVMLGALLALLLFVALH